MTGRLGVLVAALAVVATVTGGCTVERVSSETWSERAERFEETQQVHLDLRDPLTREEAGIPERLNTLIVERAGGDQMLDVEFLLPKGKRLDVPAIGVVFSAAPGAPDGGQPEEIVVNRVEPTLAQAEPALRAAAEEFGFDPALVGQFVRSARDARGEPAGYTTRSFPLRRLDYLLVEMNARAYPDRDQVQINYMFYWGESARQLGEMVEESAPSGR